LPLTRVFNRSLGKDSCQWVGKDNCRYTTTSDFANLIDGLVALGLTTATADQVEAAINAVYPSGINIVDQGEVLRAVFLHLKRQNSADNAGR